MLTWKPFQLSIWILQENIWKSSWSGCNIFAGILFYYFVIFQVFVALSNGSLNVYQRDPNNGQWDLHKEKLITLGEYIMLFAGKCCTSVYPVLFYFWVLLLNLYIKSNRQKTKNCNKKKVSYGFHNYIVNIQN